MLRKLVVIFMFCSCGFLASGLRASAKNIVLPVQSDLPEGYKPIGGRLGTVIVMPSAGVWTLSDDNIYRQSSNKKSDVVHGMSPAVSLSTDWNLHQIRADFKSNIARYTKNRSENYEDYNASLYGKYDIDYGTYAYTLVSRDKKHEERGSPDDVQGDTPLNYNVNGVTIGFVRDLGLLNVYAMHQISMLDYSNTMRGNVLVDNGAKDRDLKTTTLKLGYDLSDDSEIYVSFSDRQQDYKRNSVLFRNSHSMDYTLGLDSAFTGKTLFKVYAGLTDQNNKSYEDNLYSRYGASVLWRMDGLNAIQLDLSKNTVDTAQDGVSAISRQAIKISYDHSFRPNIFLNVYGAAYNDRYYGDTSLNTGRNNNVYQTGLGLDYVMNNYVSVRVSYDYTERSYESDDVDGYDSNRFMFKLGFSY